MKKKTIFIIFGLLLVSLIAVSVLFFYTSKESAKKEPKPKGTTASSFLLNEVGYECSKKIEGVWVEAWVGNPGTPGYNFQPSNQEDFKKYCRTSYVIEYRAVLDILKRDDVSMAIGKFSSTEAWVRALGHKYIHDKTYLNRILPAYSHIKIDCIIVVHTPESTRFFVESGEIHESHSDHQYIEVPAAEFLSSLNNATDDDVTNFWLGLH